MKSLFCPKISKNYAKIRGKPRKSTFLAQKQNSVPTFRLETMVLMGMDIPLPAIRRQIASGIDIIVHLGRLRDRSRKVLEIVEILGVEADEIQLQTLFEFREKTVENGRIKGEWVQLHEIQKKEKLLAAGYHETRVF